MYVCMYVCMCVYIYIYIYTHTYIHSCICSCTTEQRARGGLDARLAKSYLARGVKFVVCCFASIVGGIIGIIISPPFNKKPPLGRAPWGGDLFVYYQSRRRHDFPPHKIPPLGGKYYYYKFRRRHYQFRRRQRNHFIRGVSY